MIKNESSNPVIVTGHQPTYLPWLGLLHKASLADVYVFMDDVDFSERDYMQRNRIKVGHDKDFMLTVPLDRKRSASKRICDIRVNTSPGGGSWQEKHFQTIRTAYAKAAFYREHEPFLHHVYLDNKWDLLSELNLFILEYFFEQFNIQTKLVVASSQDFTCTKSDLVLEHTRRYGGSIALLGPKGRDYVDEKSFREQSIAIVYHDYVHPEYSQRFGGFLPYMCCLDLLLNHGPESAEIMRDGNMTREEVLACHIIL